jgi:hypothetical protein
MAVAIAAGIAAVAGLAGSAMSSNAAGSAAGVQAGALNNATGLQAQMYQQGQQNLAPYIGSGTEAQGELDTLLGIQNPAGPGGNNYRVPTSDASNPAFVSTVDPFYSAYGGYAAASAPGSAFQQLPAAQQQQINQAATSAWGAAQPSQSSAPGFGSLLQPFTSADLNANMAPNYEFSLQQGQGANENLANASGGLIGGNAMQGLDTFTQNYAQGAYQQAYQNYNTNLSNIYSRLSGVANQGESAAAGAATNALTAGAQMAGTTAASGAATAGGIIGSANAISGGINNAGSMGVLGSVLNNNSTTAANNAISGYQSAATSGPINPLTYDENYG